LRHGLAALLAALALVGAPPAHAGGCDACPTPTLQELAAAGMVLQTRPDPLFAGVRYRDQVYTDAGECTAHLTAPPDVRYDSSYLVVRGEGEVWNCPHSKSTDTITVEASETDSSGWTLTASTSVKLKGLAGEVSAEISAGHSTGTAITEKTSISKTIDPAWCHRVQWTAKFEVATYVATADFAFTQRWAWWTKNVATGDKALQKGDVVVSCGTATVEISRKAPIAGFFLLSQSGCGGEACSGVPTCSLGYFPELPPRLRPKDGDSDGGQTSGEGQTDEPSTTEEPGTDDPDDPTDGSTTDGSTTDGSTTDGPTTDGSTTDGSTTDGSSTDGSTTDGSSTDDPDLPSSGDLPPPPAGDGSADDGTTP
jgi:hypothetical protein